MMFFVEQFLESATYFALILVLTIAGMGVPIPEDIPLIFSGYLCHPTASPIAQIPLIDPEGDGTFIPDPNHAPRKVPNVFLMIICGMTGVLMGDSIVFSIGRRGIDGNNFIARHLRKVLHSKRREKVEHHFAKHGNLTVFAGRFMPGFRSIVFAFAGMSKMTYLRFLLIDGLAALVSVPVFVLLGWYFAPQVRVFFARLEHIKHQLIPVVIVIGVGVALIVWLRKRRRVAAPDHG
jgi:membrane protein DedA with SNARE-associated domain